MIRVITKNKKLIGALTVSVVLFILWFSWMSLGASKANLMESKVKIGLSAGIQAIERDAPRIKIVGGGRYYIPDVGSNVPSDRYPGTPREEVYAVLLETLNQDTSTPFCKVSNIGLNTTSEINAQATVTFHVFLGIPKTIVVRESQPLPHFKNATGSGHY